MLWREGGATSRRYVIAILFFVFVAILSRKGTLVCVGDGGVSVV